MSVSVKIDRGSHGSQIAPGSEALLATLLTGAGLKGNLTVRAGPQVAGGPNMAGVIGAKIRIKGGTSPRTVIFTIQPGDNGSRRDYLLDVPNGTDVDAFVSKFRDFTNKDEPTCEDGGAETTRTIAEIRAEIERLSDRLNNLPASFVDQERALSQREAEILQREKQLAEDRRKLEQERAALKQEVGRTGTLRRELEGAKTYAEMELDDAEKELASRARVQLEALATASGMTVGELILLAQRGGAKN